MPGKPPTPAELREAIAESLWDHLKSYELAAWLDGIGVTEPPSGDSTENSKRIFTRTRLMGKDMSYLADVARLSRSS